MRMLVPMAAALLAMLGSPATGVCASAPPAAGTGGVPPVVLDYFHEPGCPDCLRVNEEIMPRLRARYAGSYVLNAIDTRVTTNALYLLACQQALGIAGNEPVCFVVDCRHVLNGFAAIEEGLFDRIDECLGERLRPGWRAPEPVPVPRTAEGRAALLGGRLRQLTLPAVAVAGLADGFNPCAIGTLVFLMSLLSVSQVRGRRMLLVGIPYCIATFVTYVAIGLAVLGILHSCAGFPRLQMTVTASLTVLVAILAVLSFRDAWRFRRTRRPADVTLQLPEAFKGRIRVALRAGLSGGNLVAGAFVAGMLVTAMESVCTGQLYVPVLAAVARGLGGHGLSPSLVARAWTLLAVYNLMFLVPLVAVFVLTYRGLESERLIEWSVRNVAPSKILLGLLFTALAVLMWVV